MLTFILGVRRLGFSQPDVRQLVEMADPTRTNCDDVRRLASHQLEELQKKIRGLRQLEKSLKNLVSNCETEGAKAECPMIDSLLDDF